MNFAINGHMQRIVLDYWTSKGNPEERHWLGLLVHNMYNKVLYRGFQKDTVPKSF